MMTLDEVINKNRQRLKTIITEFEEEINNNNFGAIYGNIHLCVRESLALTAFTALLLKNKINPLKYMEYVPCSFARDLDIKEIQIPDNITAIGSYAFHFCEDLVNVVIGSGTNYIDYYAFKNCTSLKSITLPENLTGISEGVFAHCSNLTSITIPKSVVWISEWAFNNCSKLKDIYYAGSEEDWNNIKIKMYNDELLNATIHYNS